MREIIETLRRLPVDAISGKPLQIIGGELKVECSGGFYPVTLLSDVFFYTKKGIIKLNGDFKLELSGSIEESVYEPGFEFGMGFGYEEFEPFLSVLMEETERDKIRKLNEILGRKCVLCGSELEMEPEVPEGRISPESPEGVPPDMFIPPNPPEIPEGEFVEPLPPEAYPVEEAEAQGVQALSLAICQTCVSKLETNKPTLVGKTFTFSASHFLPGYSGECRFVHGHDWELQVFVYGWVDEATGMVVDFGDLKHEIKKEIIDRFDHNLLNLMISNPTAENLIDWIYERLVIKLPSIHKIVLKESPTSIAEKVFFVLD